MSEIIINSSNARKKFYQLLKEVNENHSEIQIVNERNEHDAVLISKKIGILFKRHYSSNRQEY